MKRANSVAAYTWHDDVGMHEWSFPGGNLVTWTVGPAGDFPDLSVQNYTAMCHGYKQKLGDGLAIARDPKTGKSATAETKRAAMLRIREVLLAGGWRGQAMPILVRAISDVTGKPAAEILVRYKGWTAAQRDAMEENPRFAPKVAELRKAATAGEDVDTSELDAEIDAI